MIQYNYATAMQSFVKQCFKFELCLYSASHSLFCIIFNVSIIFRLITFCRMVTIHVVCMHACRKFASPPKKALSVAFCSLLLLDHFYGAMWGLQGSICRGGCGGSTPAGKTATPAGEHLQKCSGGRILTPAVNYIRR